MYASVDRQALFPSEQSLTLLLFLSLYVSEKTVILALNLGYDLISSVAVFTHPAILMKVNFGSLDVSVRLRNGSGRIVSTSFFTAHLNIDYNHCFSGK